ncbi:hypothetical protein [Microbacterium tumbae]
MRITPLRLVPSVAAIAVLALTAVGCATTPSSSTPSSSADATPSTAPEDGGTEGFEAAWLDEGRLFAVISWGSSSCVPAVDTVEADGQQVAVSLVQTEAADAVCTADLAPRASVGTLPEGVDPTKDVELIISFDGITEDADLDGDPALTGVPGSPTLYEPSAGWFDDGGLVLLTWGSSSCPPVIDSVEGSGTAGTVAFVTDDTRVCTMDMAPRTTILSFGDDEIDDDGFQLTLVGGGLDGAVAVRG